MNLFNMSLENDLPPGFKARFEPDPKTQSIVVHVQRLLGEGTYRVPMSQVTGSPNAAQVLRAAAMGIVAALQDPPEPPTVIHYE